MKLFFPITILLIFAGMAAVGFSMIDHGAMHTAGGCVISPLTGNCAGSLVDAVRHNVSPLELLSSVILSVNFFVVLAFAFSWLFILHIPPPVFAFSGFLLRDRAVPNGRNDLSRWLARFTHSPTA